MEQKYEYTPLYYGTPCQVRYYDAGCDIYIGGIAFQDQVICGCCGGNRQIQDIIDDAALCGIHWDDAIIELEWVDISGVIQGE